MIAGSVAVTTTPVSLQGTDPVLKSAGRLVLQVIGANTVLIGDKASVTAGKGIMLAAAMAPIAFGSGLERVNLTDVWVAAVTGTGTVNFAGY